MTQAVPGHGMGAPSRPGAIPQITDAVRSSYKRSMWALVLRGLVSLTISVLVFARPLASVAALALVIALWALLDGFTNIVRAFTLRHIVAHWWVLLAGGLVSVVFGAAALYYYPALSLAFAYLWTAWWLLTAGVIGLYVAVQEKKMGVSWGWTLFLDILFIVGGISALMHPGATLASLIGFIGAFAILAGIMLLFGAFKLGVAAHHVKQLL